jgi:hypothetical protein
MTESPEQLGKRLAAEAVRQAKESGVELAYNLMPHLALIDLLIEKGILSETDVVRQFDQWSTDLSGSPDTQKSMLLLHELARAIQRIHGGSHSAS